MFLFQSQLYFKIAFVHLFQFSFSTPLFLSSSDEIKIFFFFVSSHVLSRFATFFLIKVFSPSITLCVISFHRNGNHCLKKEPWPNRVSYYLEEVRLIQNLLNVSQDEILPENGCSFHKHYLPLMLIACTASRMGASSSRIFSFSVLISLSLRVKTFYTHINIFWVGQRIWMETRAVPRLPSHSTGLSKMREDLPRLFENAAAAINYIFGTVWLWETAKHLAISTSIVVNTKLIFLYDVLLVDLVVISIW